VLGNKALRSCRWLISTHLVGSSWGLYIRCIEVEDAELAWALELYRVEDQQVRKRDKYQKRLDEHYIKLCLTLEALEARLIGVVEVLYGVMSL